MAINLNYGFTLTIDDPKNILGSNQSVITKDVDYVVSLLNKYINFSKPLDLIIQVRPASDNPNNTDGLAPSIVQWVDYSGAKSLASIVKSQTGFDPNGNEPDAGFIIYAGNDGTLKNYGSPFYFDPNPSPDSASSLPSGNADFIGVATHELFHALGIATWDAARAPWNKNIVKDTDGFFYSSPSVDQILGGKLPINSFQADHYGNDSISYQPVRSGLMYQWGIYEGNRIDIGQLDLLILKDLGYTIKNFSSLPVVDPIDKFNISGTNAADVIYANLQSSKIIGLDGNDTINLPKASQGYGNYLIDGGAGYDTAVINQQRSSFSMLNQAGNYILRDNSGHNGVSILTSIENIKFTDGSLVFDLTNTADNALIYRIYQAAFARSPDEGGFRYWSDQHNNSGLSFNNMATGFINSTEFKTKYGANPTNAQLVDLLYQNVLGRQGETGGVSYWNSELNTGHQTKEQVLIGFSGSPENVAKTAANIDNGYWLV